MEKLNKKTILKLNKSWIFIDVGDARSVVTDIFSDAVTPCRVFMENGEFSVFEKMSLKDWLKLSPKDDEDYIHTPKGVFVIPKIVICKNYDKVPLKKIVFPTKRNIWERDGHICQYTGKKLAKSELSIDHIMPKSRGGEDTWENLVTCDRMLNSHKSDRTPEECEPQLELIKKPTKPKNGLSFHNSYGEIWKKYIK